MTATVYEKNINMVTKQAATYRPSGSQYTKCDLLTTYGTDPCV